MTKREMWRAFIASGDKSAVATVRLPPCPLCHERLTMPRSSRPSSVREACRKHHHDACTGWREKRLETKFIVGDDWYWRQIAANDAWAKRCYLAIAAARPKRVPLSPRELHRRQVRAARKLTQAARRRGGTNQPREYKSVGGSKGMHQRWHVARSVSVPSCDLCKAAAPGDALKP
jgi:hypothetical protein